MQTASSVSNDNNLRTKYVKAHVRACVYLREKESRVNNW